MFTYSTSGNIPWPPNFDITTIIYNGKNFEKISSKFFKISANEEDFARLKDELEKPQKILIFLEAQPSLENTFYLVHNIKKYFLPKFMAVLCGNFYGNYFLNTILGPLNDIFNAKVFAIEMNDYEKLPELIFNITKNFKENKLHRLLVKNDVIMELDYQKIEEIPEKPHFSNKICIIFGTGTLGKAYYEVLSSEYSGWKFIFASRNASKMAEKVEAYNVDMRDRDEVMKFFGEILKKCGKIGIIVQAAGIAPSGDIIKSNEEFQKMFDVKIFGTLNVLETLRSLGRI